MKVVINGCHGGFGLSPEAYKLYASKKGKECYFFPLDCLRYYAEVPMPSPTLSMWIAKSSKDPYEANSTIDAEGDRSDPDLVATVEELGQAANARFSNLRIVEIPDGVEYVIVEYDGIEHVAEKHRTWS